MDSTRRNLLIGSILSAFAVGGLLPSTCALSQMAGTSATRNSPRKRPEGKGKPLLDEDITTVLARLDAWYAAHLPADKYVFNPPATDAQLDVFERLIIRIVDRTGEIEIIPHKSRKTPGDPLRCEFLLPSQQTSPLTNMPLSA